MPNFNTHWLVAIKCIESSDKLPSDIKDGYKKYKDITSIYKSSLSNSIKNINTPKHHKEFIKSDEEPNLNSLLKDYNKDLTSPENHDPITIFSAYMLGACGPDFWMVVSEGKWPLIPDMAAVHFDLGHYNRSHQQFIVAIERWRKKLRDQTYTQDSLQLKVEQAYFYGMATHIATDCVVHQLVNVSAGAYHMLKKQNWWNEHRDTTSWSPVGKASFMLTKQWNTHNKVEQYWDSYIRYRYLGDHDLWDYVKSDWLMTPLEFPTVEKYIADLTAELNGSDDFEGLAKTVTGLKKASLAGMSNEEVDVHYDRITAKEKMIESLEDDDIKVKIEKAFIFPRIFCDRVISGDIQPFLYDIVVRKKAEDNGGCGAYEEDIIFDRAISEAKSFQMGGWTRWFTKNYNENRKLGFFASEHNEDIDWKGRGFNFLNYKVSPGLDLVMKYGFHNFYDNRAIKPFIESALKVGNHFISELSRGINSKDRDITIGNLGKLWNLDTGLGIEVKNLPTHTRHEVITELNFIHITETMNSFDIGYAIRKDEFWHVNNMAKSVNYNQSQEELSSFVTYRGGPFGSSGDIHEETDKKGSGHYLDTIDLKTPDPDIPYSRCKILTFFSDARLPENQPITLETNKMMASKGKNPATGHVLKANDLRHRLTLNLRVPIARIEPDESLGFYVHNDKTEGTSDKGGDPQSWFAEAVNTDYMEVVRQTVSTLNYNGVKSMGFHGPAYTDVTEAKDNFHFERKNGLGVFNAKLLMNLEDCSTMTREVDRGKWNNVIESDRIKNPKSRNYAVSTGRKYVLHPVKGWTFEGDTDFEYYSDISPTEQIFFTLYRLVQTQDGCFDMLTRERVSKEDLNAMKKIDSLGFVKIVLFYQLTCKGAMQATECYVDGLKVNVLRPGSKAYASWQRH